MRSDFFNLLHAWSCQVCCQIFLSIHMAHRAPQARESDVMSTTKTRTASISRTTQGILVSLWQHCFHSTTPRLLFASHPRTLAVIPKFLTGSDLGNNTAHTLSMLCSSAHLSNSARNVSARCPAQAAQEATSQAVGAAKEEEQRRQRLFRWALQAEARYILPHERVAECLRVVNSPALGVEVLHAPAGKKPTTKA